MDPEETELEGSMKKGRRVWQKSEEDALLKCMVNEYGDKWASDNGFRSGFFTAVEKELVKVLPNSGIRASPHIDSKVRYWKTTYHKIIDILNLSGFGWDNSSKRIVMGNKEVWEEYEKNNPKKAKGMKDRSFPYFDDWEVLFGKDRATGERAEDPADMANPDPNETVTLEDFDFSNDYYPVFGEEFTDSIANEAPPNTPTPSPATPISQSATAPMSTPSSGTPHSSLPTAPPRSYTLPANAGVKKGKKRSRLSEEEKSIHASMDTWMKESSTQVAELVKSLSYDYDKEVSLRRQNVFDEVEKLDLNEEQQFKLVAIINSKKERIDTFYGVKPEKRQAWAEAVLAGKVYDL